MFDVFECVPQGGGLRTSIDGARQRLLLNAREADPLCRDLHVKHVGRSTAYSRSSTQCPWRTTQPVAWATVPVSQLFGILSARFASRQSGQWYGLGCLVGCLYVHVTFTSFPRVLKFDLAAEKVNRGVGNLAGIVIGVGTDAEGANDGEPP